MKHLRAADAWKYNETVIIHSMRQSTEGGWLLAEPIIRVDSLNPLELGKAILEALANSRGKVPWPKSWDGLFDPVLKVADNVSYRTFTRRFTSVGIHTDNKMVELEPSRRYNKSGGSVPIKEKVRLVSINDLETLGQALLAAFEDCE